MVKDAWDALTVSPPASPTGAGSPVTATSRTPEPQDNEDNDTDGDEEEEEEGTEIVTTTPIADSY